MRRILTPVSLSSSFVAIAGLLVWTGSVSLSAQGARARGQAASQDQAVSRTGTELRVQSGARAPQAESRRDAPAPVVPPSRRVDAPNATAVPRPVPQVIRPPAVASQIVQPQITRPQIETIHPN